MRKRLGICIFNQPFDDLLSLHHCTVYKDGQSVSTWSSCAKIKNKISRQRTPNLIFYLVLLMQFGSRVCAEVIVKSQYRSPALDQMQVSLDGQSCRFTSFLSHPMNQLIKTTNFGFTSEGLSCRPSLHIRSALFQRHKLQTGREFVKPCVV